MKDKRIIILQVAFTGQSKPIADVKFNGNVDIIYGASNTGKSFIIKAIDFMFGGRDLLPAINEKVGYTRCWMSFELNGEGVFTVSRSLEGGDFELYEGIVTSEVESNLIKTLAAKHQEGENISSYFLDYLGIKDKKIVAKKGTLQKNSFTIRQLIKVSLAMEGKIFDEKNSPVLSGDSNTDTSEKRAFHFILTGQDDSHIVKAPDRKTFTASKTSKIDMLTDLVNDIDDQLRLLYDNTDGLEEQFEKVTASLKATQATFDIINNSIQTLVESKSLLSNEIPKKAQRIEEMELHLQRFSVLEASYNSDIDRLESFEEASFLIGLEQRACEVCGAQPEDQKLKEPDTMLLRQAALQEISRIKLKKQDLILTIGDISDKLHYEAVQLTDLQRNLSEVELEIAQYAPEISSSQQSLNTLLTTRDNLSYALNMIRQRKDYTDKIQHFKSLKAPKKEELSSKLPESIIFEFCKVIQSVLKAWNFPGDCVVSYDQQTYDIIIDGKVRTANGKGVRAITHAAFKVAIMLYCNNKNLPHPGFLILDSPLLTYRDAINTSEALTEDEIELKEANVASHFFKHLASLKDIGQFIIMENIDLPDDIDLYANVQTFYGIGGSGRQGLFP
ncbi:MAG: hypothetical protein JO154_19680 [Chitinophaga sp.]|uniref:hypothetical protein n=1 Tax=Chitinophaga sp. TaxID=1869181 RepID=UPI0025BA5815|nr:hypothetical protein [Chitinophaga sp.]MBV8254831.1 hypothetical protein [Chitinophaga sp.]